MSRDQLSVRSSARIGEHRPRYRPDIDGLRAIAVTSVVLFHAGLWWIPSGFVGVDIFFVISGYLIGGIIFREIRIDTFSFSAFYARRFKRILPVLIAVISFVWLVSVFLLTPRELMLSAISGSSALFGISNLFFWLSTDYFSEASRLKPFLMTWSLGVEEQFYAFFPCLALLMRRWSARNVSRTIAALTGASLALSVWLTIHYPAAAFFVLPSRAWELGVGILLSAEAEAMSVWLSRSRVASEMVALGGSFCIATSVLLFRETIHFPGLVACVPVMGSAALIWSEHSFINRRILSARPMVSIGLVSYSWYLWHWPLMSLARIVSLTEPDPSIMLLVALLALMIAGLSWRYIEQPIRHARFSHATAIAGFSAALAVLATIGGALWLARGLPARVAPSIVRYEKQQTDNRRCLARDGQDQPDLSINCVPHGKGAAVAILGDSHAAALGSAIRAAAARQNWGYEQLTKTSCPVLLGVSLSTPAYPSHSSQCARYSRLAIGAVIADPRVKTVIIAAYWSEPLERSNKGDHFVSQNGNVASTPREEVEVLTRSVFETVDALHFAGKHVIVLGDVVTFDFDVGRAFKTQQMPIRETLGALLSKIPLRGSNVAWAQISSQRDFFLRVIRDVPSFRPGVEFVNLPDRLCSPRGCIFAAGGVPYFIDQHHLSSEGAQRVVEPLIPLIAQSLRSANNR